MEVPSVARMLRARASAPALLSESDSGDSASSAGGPTQTPAAWAAAGSDVDHTRASVLARWRKKRAVQVRARREGRGR